MVVVMVSNNDTKGTGRVVGVVLGGLLGGGILEVGEAIERPLMSGRREFFCWCSCFPMVLLSHYPRSLGWLEACRRDGWGVVDFIGWLWRTEKHFAFVLESGSKVKLGLGHGSTVPRRRRIK